MAAARSGAATLRVMASRRSRGPRLTAGIAAGLLLLLAGIWLGGHPSWLPSGLRDALVDDTSGRLVNQELNIIMRDYYRPVTRDQLLNKGLGAMVTSLNDPY